MSRPSPVPVAVRPHLLLEYALSPDYLERRGELRQEHLGLVAATPEIVLAGALDTADRALLVFRTQDAERVAAFVRADPYVLEGLVTGWTVSRWNVMTAG